MLQNFFQNNRANNLSKWLGTVDLSSADISQIEQQIQTAIIQSRRNNVWSYNPIAPLAEPINLNDLLGDLFNSANQALAYHAGRLDNIYQILSDSNNILVAELSSLNSTIATASTTIGSITTTPGDEAKNYLWIGDTFNDSGSTDTANTTALVDTDHNRVSLQASSLSEIPNLSISVDYGQMSTPGTKLFNSSGIYPIFGCNMLVSSWTPSSNSTSAPDPEPTLVDSDPVNNTGNLKSLLDNDPTTVFDIEINYIPQLQPMAKYNSGFVYDPSSSKVYDVLKDVTQGLDNTVKITTSTASSSLPLFQIADLSKGNMSKDFTTVKFVFDIQLLSNAITSTNTQSTVVNINSTNPVSYLNITPFIRTGANSINVDFINLTLQSGVTVPIASNITLGSTLANNSLANSLVSTTNFTSSGTLFEIPSNADIKKITVGLSSTAYPVPTNSGLAHKYQSQETETKASYTALFGLSHNSSDRFNFTRIPLGTIPSFSTQVSQSQNIFGSLSNFTNTLGGVSAGLSNTIYAQYGGYANYQALVAQGRIIGTVNPNAPNIGPISPDSTNYNGPYANPNPLQGIGSTVGQLQNVSLAGSQLSALGGTLGSVGGFLGKAVPVLGLATAGLDVLSGLAGSSSSQTTPVSSVVAYDIFNGYRAGISLSDVSLILVQYVGTSVYQTVKKSFSAPVSKVGLFVEESIPSTWGTGNWIAYYFSTDGTNWQVLPKISDTTLDGGLVLQAPTTTAYFKAVFTGNPNDIYHSPSISSYAIQGLPA